MPKRSDNITAGTERMPNRSLLRACGLTDEELSRPIIGVVSAYSEIIPGHINLDKIADAAKAGVRMAGGTPVLVPAIGVCDGIAMGHIGMKYSLASRELIADSVETLAQAHQLDGLVLIPNCDKIVPGMLMAAARLNIPSIIISGGPMLAGHFGGEEVSLSKTFEAVGAYKAGLMDDKTFYEAECNSCPGCGSCAGMYTANSMNCLSEAIGMALPGNGTTPAVSAARIHLAKHAGMKIMELVEKDIKPRDILTEKAFVNALCCEMAIGCSTNSVLHLLAIANEAGVPLKLETLNEISEKCLIYVILHQQALIILSSFMQPVAYQLLCMSLQSVISLTLLLSLAQAKLLVKTLRVFKIKTLRLLDLLKIHTLRQAELLYFGVILQRMAV